MKYENNWQSLDSRPVPQWFGEAKFGIFMHWGLYSVPAYAPKGDYAEWYGYSYNLNEPMTDRQRAYKNFHLEKYGEKFRYADFVPMFTAELFDADEWAELFSRAGAKYTNFVSKHHDGFCMYASDYAPNWNSVDVGPHRDFCAELKKALDKTDVRFGVYHSVYEWNHPLCNSDPERYAVERLIPMLKELITKYEPSTLFTDGEWSYESSVWHSTEFLQWLYNESAVRDVIVPNDRWGKETRGRHGGNFTTEYGLIDGGRKIEDADDKRVFEECRGIGMSFGYNRIETPDDYMTPKQCIETLVSLVSKGGNLLLNVGPTADGRIPEIMQERLLQMGGWLKVNGEAIYSSQAGRFAADNGVYYTRRADKDYAILSKFPVGEIVLGSVPYSDGVKAHLLGSDAPISAVNADGRLALRVPALNPDELASQWLYTFELTGCR